MDHGARIALLIKSFERSPGDRGLLDPLEREEWIMETLAEKRVRISAQRRQAEAFTEKADKLGYAATTRVRKGEVIFQCAKSTGNGVKLVWGELGIVAIEIHGPTAGEEIFGPASLKVIMSGMEAQSRGGRS